MASCHNSSYNPCNAHAYPYRLPLVILRSDTSFPSGFNLLRNCSLSIVSYTWQMPATRTCQILGLYLYLCRASDWELLQTTERPTACKVVNGTAKDLEQYKSNSSPNAA